MGPPADCSPSASQGSGEELQGHQQALFDLHSPVWASPHPSPRRRSPLRSAWSHQSLSQSTTHQAPAMLPGWTLYRHVTACLRSPVVSLVPALCFWLDPLVYHSAALLGLVNPMISPSSASGLSPCRMSSECPKNTLDKDPTESPKNTQLSLILIWK